jgi:para-aminobenzoate synthetase component 1
LPSPNRLFIRTTRLAPDPPALYRRLRRPGVPGALLESARASGPSGRYSIAASRPRLQLTARGRNVRVRRAGRVKEFRADPFAVLKSLLAERRVAAPAGVPFAGGAVGYLGYEAKNLLEPGRPARRAKPGLGLPDLCFLFFDEGILVDHAEGAVRLFCLAGDRRGADRRFARLEERLGAAAPRAVAARDAAELRASVSMTRAAFLAAVRGAKRHIRKGDIFQANLSQRFSFPLTRDPLDVYEELRRINPSPFFGFFEAEDFTLVSGSPERLVKLEGGVLETRPIAGTRARGLTAESDEALSRELFLSEKERAEHVMLVDLERNDLGRVAEYGTVAVDELMALEEYSHVKHIVSNVRADLRRGLDAVDALKALFPGGTITGAPKIRCMEIIDELEPVARGPYTGSLGYLSYSGGMDMNILIRGLTVRNGKAHLQVGAGIVADSVPEKEYDETLHKAEAVLSAVFGAGQAREFLRRLGRGGRVS